MICVRMYVHLRLYVRISLHDFPIENQDVLRVMRFQSRNGTKILTLFWTFVMILTLIFIFAAGKLSRPDNGILLALAPMFAQRLDSEIWQLRGRLLKVITCLKSPFHYPFAARKMSNCSTVSCCVDQGAWYGIDPGGLELVRKLRV